MKALTILQPFAAAIIYGGKTVENRPWPTRHTGPLLIHAGKSDRMMDVNVMLSVARLMQPVDSSITLKRGVLDFGAIIGVVEQYGCCTLAETQSEWASGPWCHLYKLPRAFREPIPYRGQQGMFEVPDEVVAEAIADALDPIVAVHEKFREFNRLQNADSHDPRGYGRLD